VVPLKIEGAYEAAMTNYEKAEKYAPQNPSLELLQARLDLAAGNVDKARQHIAQALKLKENYTEAVFLLSQIEASQGNLAEAIKQAQSAAVLAPNDPVVYFQLGLLEYNDNKFSDAAKALERSVILADDYANARYFLGLSYYELGDKDRAIEQFKKLSELDPESSEVKMILSNLNAGLSPLAGAQPPLDEAPQDRDELPLGEE
jgi:tetratricopeptide (TPR) repeat protein